MSSFTVAALPNLSRGVSGPATDAESRGQARGYAAGYAEGIRAAEAELSARRAALDADYTAQTAHLMARSERTTQAVDTALTALRARETPVVAEAHEILAASALELAEAILGYELADAETGARRAVDRALSQVQGRTISRLRMNTDDLTLVQGAGAEWPDIVFVADASLARGDAIAELSDGWLDGRLSTAVARVRAELMITPADRTDGA